MSRDLERRAVAELRADRSTITGHAIVFDVRSQDLGGFVEVIRPEAVTTSARNADVVALYNHDPGQVLGRTPKTLQLTPDARGLAFTLDVADTQAGRDALTLVRRGDVKGASFGFRTLKDTWLPERIPVREIHALELLEISLCAFPAYAQTDVSVAQRALAQFCPGTAGRSLAWLRQEARLR